MKTNKFSFVAFIFFTLTIFYSQLLFAQSVQELLKKGDDYLDVKYDNQKALDTFFAADKISPKNWEVYWRISRAYVYIAEHMPENSSEEKDAQLAVYQKALYYADQAVILAPTESITYVRRAIANGRIALFKGIFSVGGVVNSVKADCDKAISLGNGGNYVQALAHYILGRTNAEVSKKWKPARLLLGLGWADLDAAISEYKKAIDLYPNFRMFYFDLGYAYMRNDDYADARDMFNKVISSPKKDENDDSLLTSAKAILEKIKNK
ncbi:MAG: tetratricopeptide repeat protein [Ignavibacteriaceae bacterium]